MSAEFNLMYRWHAAISAQDTTWIEGEFRELFPGKDLSTVRCSLLPFCAARTDGAAAHAGRPQDGVPPQADLRGPQGVGVWRVRAGVAVGHADAHVAASRLKRNTTGRYADGEYFQCRTVTSAERAPPQATWRRFCRTRRSGMRARSRRAAYPR